MKARAPGRGWLSALLLVGLVAQAGVAATHSTLPAHAGATHGQPADDEERERHDPASCSFCRSAPAFEHGLVASPLSLPIDARAIRRSFGVVPVTRGEAPWARPAPRAPPSPPRA